MAGPGLSGRKNRSMNKKRKLSVLVIAAVAALALPVLAGQVGERAFVTLGNATGTGTWSPTYPGTARLKRISVVSDLGATNVVTAKRVVTDASGNNYTQTVGVVSCSSGAGTQGTLAYDYLKRDDVLQFSSFTPTGGVALVEYELQRH